jgi:Protein of unknown function (DUF3187)
MAYASIVRADEGGQFYGLLRSRDLTPFGFLRLDMRPAHAVSIEPGTWALIVGYEYQLTPRTNLNLQAYVSTSVYSREQTDLDELLGTKYQYSIGLRHRRNNMIFTFGFTENVQNINNTPDVGLQLGFAYVPFGK